jgi:CHAT domain-containing protein/tetratricopeptide (TPR) repeat protein
MNIRHTSRHQWFTPSRLSRRGLLIFVSIALLVAGWSFRSFYSRKSAVTTGLEKLVAAYEGRRPLQARISGLAYAPFISRRGEADDFDPVNRDLAERLLLEAVAEKPTSTARQALGQFYLMSGSPAKAGFQFEEALKQDQKNSALHNDYGVALLESGKTARKDDEATNALQYFARSFEEVELAIQLNAANVEALHNRALVLEQLKLPEQQKKAWQEYLAKETNPSWTAEARRNLETLAPGDSYASSRTNAADDFLVAVSAQDDQRAWQVLTGNKEMITERFIPQELANSFLKVSANGDQESANKFLAALRFAGKLEIANARDPFVSDIAQFYARTSVAQRKTLQEAHALIRKGYVACLNADYDKTVFVEAQKLFLRAGDVWEARICDYWIAYCLGQDVQLKGSIQLLESLAQFSKARQYHWLTGMATCWIANNYNDLGEYSKSIESYDVALKTATAINDVYHEQKILSQWGNTYMLLNQPERALQYNWLALQLIDPSLSSLRQTWRIYLYTARALMAEKLFEAANQYEQEMLSLALNVIKDPAVSHFSYLYLAQMEGGRKNYPIAIQFTLESLKLADSVADAENREKLRTGAYLLLAQLQRQSGAVTDALTTYNDVIERAGWMELQLFQLDAYKGMLLCYIALKDNANLEAQLPKVLEEFEKNRQRIVEEQNRNTFFDLQQNVYDLAINHAVERQDYLSGLNYSEQSRARSLFEALKNNNNTTVVTLNPAEIQRQLPSDLQVLQYAVLDDKVVAWLITRNSITGRVKEIRADELRSLTSEYVKGISSGPGQAEKLRPLANQLYDILIGPFSKDLDPRKTLCIIPDKTLSYVPFTALISSTSQRYLVSDFLLLTAPSLNVLVHCTSDMKNQASRNDEAVLAIGNPSFDRSEHPELDDLPAATREATGIAARYPRAVTLVGAEAIKPAIVKRLPAADVIHFAGHYVSNQREPLLSKLILAKQKGSPDNDLTVGELLNMRLPRAKLVVLSACETSGRDYYKGEGLVGIARTFLELGVPLVVASQWSVESESTARLMLKLHEFRKSGQSSIEALHNAQLAMLNDQDTTFRDPYYWAAFTPLGGYVQF